MIYGHNVAVKSVVAYGEYYSVIYRENFCAFFTAEIYAVMHLILLEGGGPYQCVHGVILDESTAAYGHGEHDGIGIGVNGSIVVVGRGHYLVVGRRDRALVEIAGRLIGVVVFGADYRGYRYHGAYRKDAYAHYHIVHILLKESFYLLRVYFAFHDYLRNFLCLIELLSEANRLYTRIELKLYFRFP